MTKRYLSLQNGNTFSYHLILLKYLLCTINKMIGDGKKNVHQDRQCRPEQQLQLAPAPTTSYCRLFKLVYVYVCVCLQVIKHTYTYIRIAYNISTNDALFN